MIDARVVAAPGPIPIFQRGKPKTVNNGDVVKLTLAQVEGCLIECPELLNFRCPRCRRWLVRLFGGKKLRLCLDCLEWRALKRPTKKKGKEGCQHDLPDV